MTSIVAYIIPDIPSKLRQQLRQESILTNEIVLETELKRARGEGESLSQEEMKNIRRRAILMLDSVDSRSNALKVIVNTLQSKSPDDSSPKIATVSSWDRRLNSCYFCILISVHREKAMILYVRSLYEISCLSEACQMQSSLCFIASPSVIFPLSSHRCRFQ